jgi:hypothetical protein
VLPYAPGRADTVVGRLPGSLLSEIEELVPEERYRELEASIGEEELPEVPDRRSKRQIESEERERARRDAASRRPAETDGLGSLAETLLGLGEGEGGPGSTPGPSEPAAHVPPSDEDRERAS